ncbi:MAG: acyl-CoA synthetase (AMP-forming)/AMP-acid ligase II [Haloquadratum walsbyi J07HQW1]|uniref:Acyl-CoA synthetase (AMP-forming)/AMP-acid ligase II n=1 Tax=Haloquadratum walsbyi J07HQW1 TaxID=1238424 RepID=U1MMM6_9EURY|nr:MAG: acyl-CoA synthetase (AMP-forming)/AMP-acid ligase II [Haloquadratum walsbyi J07HQW1]
MQKPLLVTDFLDRARRYYGDCEAVVGTDGSRYTYNEIGSRADGFSAALKRIGVEKGDRVAVLDPNTHYHLEAAYGTFQIGGIHTPLNYRLTADDYEYILSDADVSAVYADYEYAEKIDAIRDNVPTETFITNDISELDTDAEWHEFDDIVAQSTEYNRPSMNEDEVVTINYTSGTTGDPKGVCRTHRTETLHAQYVSIHQQISDGDVYLWTLPMFHVNGWGHIYAITGLGGKHVCTRGIDAEWIFNTIRSEDVSYLCAAPTVLNMLMDRYQSEDGVKTTGDAPVRAATAGAAPPEATIRTVEEEFGWDLLHVYGATETGPLITTSDVDRRLDESDNRFGLMKKQGIGYLGTEVTVVDENGERVPWDGESIGEIVVRGNQVMDRYWNKPDQTETAFSDRIDGYYHMGDLAVVDENGFIEIQDRKKDIIISGGENISSIELEDTLFSHDAVSDVAVIPVPSEEWGESPKAFVVPVAGDPQAPNVSEAELIEHCQEALASYKIPREIEFVSNLPRTATGKVQKYELRESEWEGQERMVGEG